MSEKLEMRFRYRVNTACFKRTYPGRSVKDVCHEALKAYERDKTITPCIQIIGEHRNPRKNPNKKWTVSDTPKKLDAFFKTLHGALTMTGALDVKGDGKPIKRKPERVVKPERDRSGPAKRGAETRKREKAIRAKQARPSFQAKRSRQYQESLRELKAEHPRWTHKQAQAEYRRRKQTAREKFGRKAGGAKTKRKR